MKTLNIALVDDEKDFHEIFNIFLRPYISDDKVAVFNFLSAIDFLEYLETDSHQVRIIILLSDINMPDMDGISLCEIINEKYPHIETYIATAYGNDEYKSKAKEVGVKDFFTKPVNFKVIQELIEKKIEEYNI